MKKILLSIILLIVISNIASAKNYSYENELSTLRSIKNAKLSALNKEINKHKDIIEKTTLDNTLSQEEKNQIFSKEQEFLLKLYKEKSTISKEYNANKKDLKLKFK